MSSLPARDFTNPRAKHGFQGRTCSVTGVGAYVPERVVTNADLEKVVETTDEWITSRTGIRARRIAAEFGLHHEVVSTAEMLRPEYRANPVNRCYYCKHELYTHLSALGRERGAVVVDGNNADDRADYRPGRAAARDGCLRRRRDRSQRDLRPRAPHQRHAGDRHAGGWQARDR